MHLTRRALLHRLTDQESLLVNTLSGAVDLVDNDLRTKLLQLRLGGVSEFSPSHQAALLERGYLFEDADQEEAALASVFQDTQQLATSRPLQFVICPTYSCNLACRYCFQGEQLHRCEDVLAVSQLERLYAAIDQLAACHPQRKRQLVLFGGEPLQPTTEEVLGAMLTQAQKAGDVVQIVSNGVYLTALKDLMQRFRETVKGVQLTLDGPPEVHDLRRITHDGRGSFSQTAAAVDTCLALGLPVNLRVNLDAQNLPYLEALAELIAQRGWNDQQNFRCQLAPVTDHVGNNPWPFLMKESELVEPVLVLWTRRPELRKTLDFRLFRVLHHLLSVVEGYEPDRTVPRFHYCEADRGDVYTFGPDGFIYVCTEAVGNEKMAVGRFLPKFRLWPQKLDRWHGRSVMNLSACRECPIATFCGGGCAYAAASRYGNPRRPMCDQAKETVQAYLDYIRQQRRRAQQGATNIAGE